MKSQYIEFANALLFFYQIKTALNARKTEVGDQSTSAFIFSSNKSSYRSG